MFLNAIMLYAKSTNLFTQGHDEMKLAFIIILLVYGKCELFPTGFINIWLTMLTIVLLTVN